MTSVTGVSAIIPVTLSAPHIIELTRTYIDELESLNKTFEVVFVIDGDKRTEFEKLQELAERDKRIKLIKFAKSFGDATAIAAGFRNSQGEVIITLPARAQIEPSSISSLVNALDSCDMAVASRIPRADTSAFEALRRKTFHWLIRISSGESFSDLGCSARAFRRTILDEIPIYGEQHIFLPLLAAKHGFRIREIDVMQSPRTDTTTRSSTGFYLQRVLDIFSVVFLVRFTKKPIRFFGMIGSITFVFGVIFLLYIIGERLLFDVPLADRPALLVSSLLTVLGLQIFALGLLGELIIFTHAREIKEYTIEKIVN